MDVERPCRSTPYFEEIGLTRHWQRTAAGVAVPCQSQRTGAGVSAFFTGIGLTSQEFEE
jgi:hypothetical protein